MAETTFGKAIFAHIIPAILGGDINKIVEWMDENDFDTIIPKIADGAFELRVYSKANFPQWLMDTGNLGRVNVSKEFVDAMHKAGKRVVGFVFNYLNNPEGEGEVAAEICNRLLLDGVVFDFEGRAEGHSDAVGRAGKMIGRFVAGTKTRPVPIILCSWAFYWDRWTGAQIHKPELARFMMGHCDIIMPMSYHNKTWYRVPVPMTSAEAIEYCRASALQQLRITDKPIVMALRAYTGDGAWINADHITALGIWARDNFIGAAWWFLDHAHKDNAATVALGFTPGWDGYIPPPPPPPVEAPKYIGKVKSNITLGLNVRAEPTVTSLSLGKLTRNTEFGGDRTEVTSGKLWIHITAPRIGWISAEYTDTL